MLIQTEALVINQIKYSDKHNIVKLYTQNFGTIHALVPLTKQRTKGLKANIFQPLTLLNISWQQTDLNKLIKLKTAEIHIPYTSLPYHPVKNAIALFLSDVLTQILRGGNADKKLFFFIQHSLLWLDHSEKDFANFPITFLLRLMRFLGISPNIKGYKKGAFFDLLHSEFTETPSEYNIAPDEVKVLLSLLRIDYPIMRHFSFSRLQRGVVLRHILTYYQLHWGGFSAIKSLEVVQTLF